MNRLERLYAISDVLRRESPWPVSASRLADRFDVSRRTIERDIALPDETRVQVDDLRRRIRVVPVMAGTGTGAIRSKVEEAVRTGTVMAISYRDRNSVLTRRLVEPVGFFGNAEHWSLVAWCRLRDAGRLFHLERIMRAQLTRERAPDRDYDEVLGWVPDRGAGLVDSTE